MPILTKAKWEIFAQELANGTDVQKAYVKAGYKPGKGNAYTMKNSREIQNRVIEILSARAEKVEQQYEAEVEYTRERLLSMLQTAYDRALTPDKDSGAKPSPAAAVNAVVGMARITGHIIDRREVGPAGAFEVCATAGVPSKYRFISEATFCDQSFARLCTVLPVPFSLPPKGR